MKRFQLAAVAVVGFLALLVPATARGQVGGPRPVMAPVFRPAVSPYLNLLRRGQSTALNYYNLVLPEVNFAKNISDINDQVIGNQRSITQLEDTSNTLPDTGHHAQFMSHAKYFMNSAGGGVGGGRSSGVSQSSPTTSGRVPSGSGSSGRGSAASSSRGR